MENNRALNKIHITNKDLDLIKEAVAKAEKIQAVKSPWPLFRKAILTLLWKCLQHYALPLFLFIMLYFGDGIWRLLQTKLWYPAPKILTAVIGFSVWIIMLLFFC